MHQASTLLDVVCSVGWNVDGQTTRFHCIRVIHHSEPLCPVIKSQSKHEHKHSHIISGISILFSVLGMWLVLKVEHVTSYELLTLFHFGNHYRKASLVGADCHVPKATSWPNSTSHTFLGGGPGARQGSLFIVQTSTMPFR